MLHKKAVRNLYLNFLDLLEGGDGHIPHVSGV